jgi:O-antigen ligase
MNTYIRYGIFAGLALVLLVPLVVSDSLFFPFITGKNFFFRIVVELLAALWLIGALYDPALRPKRSAVAVSFALLLVTMAISTVFSVNPYKSFWSNFERMEGFVSLLHLFAYFLVLSSTLVSVRAWRMFWHGSLAVSAVTSFYGLSQLAGATKISMSASRLDATFGNATYFAIYLLIHIFIALYLWASNCSAPGWRERTFSRYAPFAYGTLILLETVMLYYTGTRGALLGLLGGLFVAAGSLLLFAKSYPRARKLSGAAIAAIVLLVLVFIAARDTKFVRESQVLSRFASISLEDTTTKSRFLLWGMALEGLSERPIFGWGQESFNYVFNKYYDPGLWASEQWFDRTHNVIFDWLIAGGILGLLAYLALFASGLRALYRSPEFSAIERAIITGLFAAYFIHNLFVFDNIVSWIMFASLLAWLHSLSSKQAKTLALGSRLSPATRDRIVVPLVIIVALALVWSLNAKHLSVASGLVDARSGAGGQAALASDFEKLLERRTFGRAEVREQLFQVALQLLGSNADPLVRANVVRLAQREALAQLAETPNDARYHFFYGILLASTGDAREAGTYFQSASELSPKKQSMLFELSNNLILQGKKAEGLAAAERAFELDRSYDAAAIVYAAALIANARASEAESLLAERFGSPLYFDNAIVRAYASIGDDAKVLALWKIRAASLPNDPGAQLALSAAYLGAGDRAAALKTLEDTLTLYARLIGYSATTAGSNPQVDKQYQSFKGQIDYYIKEIKAGRNPTQ